MLERTRQGMRALFRRGRVEAELDEELRYHLEREIERKVAGGMAADEARYATLREFGNVESLKEESRDARGTRPWEDLVGDLRYAARLLRRGPGFAAAAVLLLALGIGGSTAIFGLIDTLLLASLPVEVPEQLDFVQVTDRSGGGLGAPPYPVLEEMRAGTRSFSGIAAYSSGRFTVSVDDRPEQVAGQMVSGDYFEVLGVRAALGRVLTPGDESLDPPVAVISDAYWRARFGGRPDILGQTIRYRDWTLSVVGVMPPGFTGLEVGHPVEVTIPLSVEGELMREPWEWWLGAVARRKPGATRAGATAELDRVFQRVLDARGISAKQRERFNHMELVPAARGSAGLRSQYSRPLLLLMGLVGTVLLIACTNIASLLLARSAARRREFAVRTAIGATRFRLVRQLLAESLFLSIPGTAAGAGLGLWLGRFLAGLFAEGRDPVLLDLRLSPRVLLFAAALCLLTTALFGLAPALRAARTDPSRDLRGGGGLPRLPLGLRASAGRVLAVGQIVLSLVLLLCAGLFVRSLAGLRAIDLGFEPEGVVTLSLEPPAAEYPDARMAALWSAVLERAERVPGVRSASLSHLTPFSGRDRGRGMEVPGFDPPPDEDHMVHVNSVSPDYFATIGTPLRGGRAFTRGDASGAAPVALVNRTAAEHYFGGRDPVGTTIRLEAGDSSVAYQVVGVVEDAKHNDLREPAPRFLYLPVAQSPERLGRLTLAARTTGSPDVLVRAISREIRDLAPDILVTEVTTAERQVSGSLLRERLVAMLSSAFGALGLVLAALGLFGVISYGVARRTREIAIRMALGARAGSVRWEVMREGLGIVGAGVVIGLPLGLLVTRAAAGLLYGVGPHDASVSLACVAILVAVAAGATFLPARRASRTEPMVALRSE